MAAEGEGPGGGPFSLPREARITASGEIREMFRKGKRRKTRHLDALVSPSPSPFPRLGVVVPKHKHSIVERNLVKRRLRELGRTVLLPALRNSGRAWDVLLRARPDTYAAPFAALREDLEALTEELCSRAP